MTVSAETDRNVIQALAHVARLAEYTLASVTTSDDAQKRVLTIKFSGISSGFTQDYLPFDAEPPLVAHMNGRGEVVKIDGLQPGDLAETDEQANAEIAAEAEQIGEATDEPRHGTEIPVGETATIGEDPDELRETTQPFVGELAAAAKQNRRK